MFAFDFEVPDCVFGVRCMWTIFAVKTREAGEVFGTKPGNKSANNGALGGINTWRTVER